MSREKLPFLKIVIISKRLNIVTTKMIWIAVNKIDTSVEYVTQYSKKCRICLHHDFPVLLNLKILQNQQICLVSLIDSIAMQAISIIGATPKRI